MGGMLIIYEFKQCMVHKEMQKILNNSDTRFQKIILSINDFHKKKINAREIFINGKLYDIKSISIIGNKIELLAFHDKKEENIFAEIKKAIRNNNEQNSQLPNRLIKLLTLFYVSPIHYYNLSLSEKKENKYPLVCEIILSHKPDISSPPPEFI